MAASRLGSWVLLLLCFILAGSVSAGQTTTQAAASDPQAVILAEKAMAALTGGVAIADVTLAGTATRTAGSEIEEGSITLKAKGTTQSRFDLSTSSGTRSEIRTSASGEPEGAWVAVDGVTHAMAGQNCMTDAAWFFPLFSVLSQASTANMVAKYVGEETRNGTPVQHIRFAAHFAGADAASASLLASLTTEDVYLDSASLLPVAISFNAHADSDALTNIAVEIDFSNYQVVSGARVPFKIQKLLNSGPFLDIDVQSVTVNSGLSDSTFAIQ